MRVLAIDGGGIRGLIPAVVLAELERRTGRPISDLFDLIAGTSTGGILACALARPHVDVPGAAATPRERVGGAVRRRGAADLLARPRQARRACRRPGRRALRRRGLHAALARYLADTPLSAARTGVLVTAYEIEQRFAFLFRSSRARVDPTYDFAMADVGLATSAAPTYFEPVAVRDRAGSKSYALVDGGVFANNPAMVALAEVAHPDRAAEVDLLLSLGTGEHTRPIRLHDARGWGQLQWAPRIVDVVFDGVAETVDFEASQLLGDRYVRLQTPLTHASDDLDDASPELTPTDGGRRAPRGLRHARSA